MDITKTIAKFDSNDTLTQGEMRKLVEYGFVTSPETGVFVLTDTGRIVLRAIRLGTVS